MTSRRVQIAAPALVVLAFAIYSFFAVGHLDNNLVGDVDRAGWAGALAARLGHGAELYRDVVVSMPPGAIVLMRLVQRIAGRPLLVQELWVVQIARLALALVAWSIAGALGSRRTGILVLGGTLAVLSQMPRECADEALAAVCAWGSLAAGVRALAADGARRRRWFAITGALASLALAFETAMGAGAVVGWAVAIALFARADVKAWLAGAGAGIAGLVALVLAAGATPAGYARAVIADGWTLHGGATGIAGSLLLGAFRAPALPASMVLLAVAVGIGWRMARAPDGAPAPLVVPAALLAVAAFGGAIALVALGAPLPRTVAAAGTAFALAPSFGIALAFAIVAVPGVENAGLWKPLVVVAVVVTVVHGLAYPALAPALQYGPVIGVGVIALFVALERARLPALSALALVILLGSLFSMRAARAASARTAVGTTGNWAGLSVSVRGQEVLRAARRVQAITAPDDTVLVLPDDPELAALVGRPRPPVRGAVVLAGEYPARLADDDIRALDAHPPRVVVVAPRTPAKWQKLFRLVGHGAAARRVIDHVEKDLLPGRYRLDSSYRCLYFFDQGVIDVWVRR